MQIPKLGDVVATRYELTGELGRGGFGVVYKATQIGMNRPVALKVLLPQAASVDTVAERFTREAQLAKNLVHPNTIQLFDFGETDGGCLYIAMEFLEGETLDQLLKREGQLPMERVVHIASQILKSLSEAHEHGIVHRDLKPANIFLRELVGEKDFVKVLDFGIAKALNLDGVEEEKLTQTGSSFGTPSYMSPEQIRGTNIGPHTDLYALALIMVKMLTGQTAVEGGTPIETAAIQLSANPVPIPDWIQQSPLGPVINKALAKGVEERYGSALDMLTDLQRVASMARGQGPGPAGGMYTGGMTPPSGQLVYSGQYDYNSLQLSGPVPMPPPQQSGSGWKIAILVVLVLLVAGGGVAAFLLLGTESGDTKQAQAQESSNDDGQETEEETTNGEEQVGADGELIAANETDPKGDPTEAGSSIEPLGELPEDSEADTENAVEETAAVEMVDVKIESDPKGAVVKEGNKLLGTTPLTASFEAEGGLRTIEVGGPGLEAKEVEVDPENPEPIKVELRTLREIEREKEREERRKRRAEREKEQKDKPDRKKEREKEKEKEAEKEREKKTVIPLPD